MSEITFMAVGNDELETKMVWTNCQDCGAKVEHPVGEIIWCANDENRPRPKCPNCGREIYISKAKKVE